MEYNFKKIEEHWQKYWKDNATFKAENTSSKPKYYVLDMFPYPSGAGLHVGHPLGYIASDIYARYKRHKGFNVLHPMGYDSFGLPAEQYAIQTGQHPKITTEQNIARYRQQLDKIGFSFDWSREVRTSNPDYYKWTQWIFIQLFNAWYNKKSDKTEKLDTLIKEFETNGNTNVNAVCADTELFSAADWKSFSEKKRSDVLMNYRIAYLSEARVNWCPAMGTVLANDEVKDGVSERGGYPVEQKLMQQWSMRITAYAQRLLDGLDTLDWPEPLKESQRYWIGKSEGTSLKFSIQNYLSPALSEGKGAMPDYHTTDSQMWNLLQDKAIAMRDNPTTAESALWQSLKGNKLDEHFRRQHIIDRFIADFVCIAKKLVVEVDGDIHDYQKEEDVTRTERLNELGYKVIRFKNEQVLVDIESVVNEIKIQIKEQSKVLPFGEDLGGVIEVFTTRPDTIFGVSFVTLAPEHELVDTIVTPEQKAEVDAYVTQAKNRSERERQADVKRVSGVFSGAYVIHPFTQKQIPIWIGDYVLAGYGTGAVMAVPGHDSRDYAFAKHFKLPIIEVVAGGDLSKESYDAKEGKLINSGFLNGLDVKQAIKHAIEEIENLHLGKGKINFRLRDAVFGRQRYWGEPIPIYYKDGIPQAMPENELPLVLPEVDKYLPTESGEPPLARAKDWKYKGEFAYEHTTMPGWAGSSWYFLRYMDAHNDAEFADKKLTDYWKEVDLYIGGSEHATGHLLYVRFWTKALKDLGYISIEEPAKKLINQGMIQGRSSFVYFLVVNEFKNTQEAKNIKNAYEEIPKYIFLSYNKGALFEKGDNGIRQEIQAKLDEIELQLNSKYEDLNLKYDGVREKLIRFHVDVNIVDNDILDIKYLKEKEEYAYAEFILEDGKYICGHEVEKMSKSKVNVVTPDDICTDYGADTLRLYEMFLGPLEQSKPWNTNGITGVHGFLKKLWRLFYNTGSFAVSDVEASKAELKALHKSIKKITEDIERFSFNTSVSNFMILVNELTDLKCNKRAILEPLLIILSPYAPHITEELWKQLGHAGSIATESFPMFNEAYLVEDNFAYPISFNGKTRFNIELPLNLSQQEIEKIVMEAEQTRKYLDGKTPKKVIVVPKKIVNIVV
ncbi:MAG: leucine--tRNA ligase [Bacteroidia bacterium]